MDDPPPNTRGFRGRGLRAEEASVAAEAFFLSLYLAKGRQINLASPESYRVSGRLDMPLKGEE